MTVIVANRDIMAADRQTTRGDQKFHSTKIFKIRRSLFGMAGDAVQCEEFINWKRGCYLPNFPSCSLVPSKPGISATFP